MVSKPIKQKPSQNVKPHYLNLSSSIGQTFCNLPIFFSHLSIVCFAFPYKSNLCCAAVSFLLVLDAAAAELDGAAAAGVAIDIGVTDA